MRLRRVAVTRLPALFDRLRQEVRRRVDRMLLSASIEGAIPFVAGDHLLPSPRRRRKGAAHQERALDAIARPGEADWPGAAARAFFAGGSVDRVLAMLLQREPESCRRITAAAEKVCAGRFDLLGYRALDFGDPPDWHLDAVSGRRAPRTHWSRIDPLDPEAVGDSKVVWELNRHQWMVTLAQAYRLHNDERYADTFVRLLRSWMSENKPGIGINWASSLEVSFRLIAWSWAMYLLRPSPSMTPALQKELLGWVRSHAGHVLRYLSEFYSPNTHLTGEALGLYYAGVLFPDLDGANRWRSTGRRILLRELDRQVGVDGVYFELSTCYQRYTAEIYQHFLLLSRHDGKAVPPGVEARVQGLIDWLLAMRHPDGSMPKIGDGDSGSLLPLVPRDDGDCRGVFALAAAEFQRSDYAWAAGDEGADVAWLLGADRYEAFRGLARHPPESPPSRCFPQGGFVIMRNGWRSDAHQLIFDAGPIGCPLSSGHGHADLLSIDCAAYGVPQVADPGTGCYTADSRWRNYFRSTHAHSTVMVDGLDQAAPAGPFSWRAHPAARLRCFTTAPDFDYADAEHDAYRGPAGPVNHRRRILFVKPRYWIVIDDVAGAGTHTVELRYQLAGGLPVAMHRGWIRTSGEGGPGLFVRADADLRLKHQILCGSRNPYGGWHSRKYGQRSPAPLLRWWTTAALPMRIVSLLVPSDGRAAEIPRMAVDLRNQAVSRVTSDTEEIWIDADDVSIEHIDNRRADSGRDPSVATVSGMNACAESAAS